MGHSGLLLALLAAIAVIAPASAEARVYIVGYETSAGNPGTETAQREEDAGFEADYVYTTAVRGFAADLSADQVAELQADPDVAYVVRDRPVEALGGVAVAGGETIPTGVRRLGAATTATVSPKSDVAVAVLDTGIDLANPDLDAFTGKNCMGNTASAQDDHGHGTHVAGTIGAKNTGAGVVGVAPGTRLYAVKVLDSTGSGSTSSVICGIDWVTANAAALDIKVANMSLGGDASSVGSCVTDPQRAAICRATTAGVSFVVAAGNEGRDIAATDLVVPATFPEVLTVSAFGDSDGVPGAQGGSPSCSSGTADDSAAGFSNFATRAQDVVHIVSAPGVCVRSDRLGGGTATMSGTSMAAPHVAGAVALCVSAGGFSGPCGGLSPAQVIERMRSTAQARATTFGFQGDPLRPLSGRTYGYAVNIAGASAATGASSEVGQTSGKVNGVVYPVDGEVTARFEYGTTTGYGSATDAQTIAASSGPTAVGGALGGLAPGTTYHYRLTVSDGSGTSSGTDRTFTTVAAAPLVPSTPVTAPVSVPALPAVPAAPGTTDGTSTDPGSGSPTTTPARSTGKPSKTCTKWKTRLTKANKTLASARRRAKGRRVTDASRKKLRAAEAAVRTAKAKVKRYC